MRNFIKFKGLFRTKYIYVDSPNYAADSLFYKRKIPVTFKGEFENKKEPFILVTCKIKNKYMKKFEEALEELYNKMELIGCTDYDDWCKNFFGIFESKGE